MTLRELSTEQKPALGLVEFQHLHVARRALAFMLALARVRPTPFDEERAQAEEAIRAALEHPKSIESCNSHAQLLEQREAMREALDAFITIMDDAKDGGEGIFEARLERLLPMARAALASVSAKS